MKYALVDNIKSEASKGVRGICPSCGSELISKCGEKKANHWAHKVKDCDSWSEGETDWHRNWKNHFPIDWQEITHTADDGKLHRADVRTDQGWVLEFQHSYLKPEEKRSRDEFYSKLVWVVDGVRRKRDKNQFNDILEQSRDILHSVTVFNVHFPDDCRILEEWRNSSSLVFFDFQEPELWFILPDMGKLGCFLAMVTRKEFVDLHKNKGFENFFNEKIQEIREEVKRLNPNKRSYSIQRSLLPPRRIWRPKRHL
ncbi:MAG: competence protein CoiA family protein [Balneola sp.]